VLLNLLRLREELGALGVFSIGLLVAVALFLALVVKPAQERTDALDLELAKHANRPVSTEPAGAGDRLAALYRFLQRSEAPTDWLAKLYGIAVATGVELQSASYRTPPSTGRVERYEISLPLTGSYAQIREFIKRSLAEIPILSIDQLSIKRQSRNDGTVQAELKLTLHRVKGG
jgi:hypothetical protein